MSAVLPHLEITPQRPHWLAGAPGFEPGNGGIKIHKTLLIRIAFLPSCCICVASNEWRTLCRGKPRRDCGGPVTPPDDRSTPVTGPVQVRPGGVGHGPRADNVHLFDCAVSPPQHH